MSNLLKRFALAVPVAGLALAPVSAAIAQEPQRGGTLIFAIGSEPSGINRNVTSANPDGLVACTIYQGLVDVEPDGTPVPLLAKSWKVSDDGLTYTFELNEARWHDGETFNADDVKYTLEEVSSKYSAVFAGAAKAIDKIEAVSDRQVVIHLKNSYGPFLMSLGCAQGGAILPKHVFSGTDVAANPATTSKPVGTGPFKLVEWRRGSQIKLEKNKDYWEPGKPYLDGLIARIMPQAASRTQAMLAGELDYISHTLLPANDYPRLESGGFKMLPTPIPALDMMFLNTKREALSDRRVRQALLMATDREYLLKSGYHGLGLVGTMPLSKQMKWATDPETDYNKLYPFDAKAANALLDEAGKKRGADGTRFTVTLNYFSDDQEAPLVATAIKSMWREIGVNVNIVPGERVSMIPKVFEQREFDIALAALTSNGDPALGLARTWISGTAGRAFGNPTGYSNPEVDALMKQGEEGTNFANRGVPYAKAQRILGKDLPALTLHERGLNAGMISKLQGVEKEYYLPTFRNAWIQK